MVTCAAKRSDVDKLSLSDSIMEMRATAFPEEYSLIGFLRPQALHAEEVLVQKMQRLTPMTYDRNIFHLELDVRHAANVGKYQMGDALAVYPSNPDDAVDRFIRLCLVDPSEINPEQAIKTIRQQLIKLPLSLVTESSPVVNDDDTTTTTPTTKQQPLFTTISTHSEESKICLSTVERVLTTVLDICSSPMKEFLKQLSKHAMDILEKVRLAELTLDRYNDEYLSLIIDPALTYIDIFEAFPTARPSIDVLLELIPPMKPRLYSIASSSLYCPGQLDLLVVEATWTAKPLTGKLNPLNEWPWKGSISGGRSLLEPALCSGLCSHYLSTVKEGDKVVCALSTSTMQLPPIHTTPIVMAGLGTGMAPFRAFLQEKCYWKARGVDVGPLALYFGSRHKQMEFLYGEELELMEAEGLLTRLSCAFSRDQPGKIYIQDRIRDDAELLAELLVGKMGHFYLCGPTWPAEDVKEALLWAFIEFGGLDDREGAETHLKIMKEKGRYVMEVY